MGLWLCSTQSQAANATQHFEDTFTATIDNECTGELVDFVVSWQGTFHISLDKSGGLHISGNDVFSARGTGETSGISYLGNQTDSFSFNLKVGEEATQDLHFSMISKGGTSNFQVHETAHYTVNANGVVTVSFDNLRITCQ